MFGVITKRPSHAAAARIDQVHVKASHLQHRHCGRCPRRQTVIRKPFGTLKAIETMIGKLAGHPAFQGAGAERLKMCGDCRVIDLHSRTDEVRITDLPR